MVLQRLDFQQDYPHSFLRTACESRKTLRMWGSLPSVSPLAASAPAIWIGVECSTAIEAILCTGGVSDLAPCDISWMVL